MLRSVPSADALARCLSIRDLTDPAAGPHAMQVLVDAAARALASLWGCGAVVHRAPPEVSVRDNYDRLHYEPDAVTRDARYTRYVSETQLLRTHTTAMIPPLLASLPREGDRLLVCPGLVYRRDCIDRLHTGEPHQMDLWRLRYGEPLGRADLLAMIAAVVGALLPGRAWRVAETTHPYTLGGLQVDVETPGAGWVEIGECGLALPALLSETGHDPARASGLAMGLGLDRLLMLRKGVGDIRLLRSADPRIAGQMLDLSPYREVSAMPPVRRDLSIVTHAATTAEDLGDRVRSALGDRAAAVESVVVLSETPCSALPPAAVARLRIAADQKNVLLRVVLRDLERTLTHDEANALRDSVYAAVHEGLVHEWARRTG